jgi:hypothetical protein
MMPLRSRPLQSGSGETWAPTVFDFGSKCASFAAILIHAEVRSLPPQPKDIVFSDFGASISEHSREF